MPTLSLTQEEVIKRCSKTGALGVGVKVLSMYRGAKKVLSVQCLKCGKQWSATAMGFLHGSGCRKCNTPQGFLTKEEVINRCEVNGISVISEYKGIKQRLSVKCLTCHYVWNPLAGHLVRGSKCPKCTSRKRAEQQRFTHTEFVNRMNGKHPDLYIAGQYNGAWQRINVACLKCLHKWSPLALSLSDGSGCPKCAIPGFRFNKPGTLYYVRVSNPFGEPVYKIGITNKTIKQRFGREFSKMVIIETWHFQNGAEAFEMEQDILNDYDADRYTGPDILNDGNDELFNLDVLGLDRGRGQLELVA
jgi:hypothetical protein